MTTICRAFVSSWLLVAVVALPVMAEAQDPEHDTESRVQLRSIDRATVRIVTVGGADATAFDSERSGVTRVAAIPRAQHGTGVVVEPSGLVLTARHVLWGSDAMAVLLPGSDDPLPARVVYVHPDRDIAFLQVKGETPDHLALPEEPRRVKVAERISASGYPIDIRQRYPAAVSGELSRENNDGSLQVAMSVNPGNSGGPVVGDDGALIGILSKRGEPRAGVAGVAILEPVRFVLPAYERAKKILAERPPRFEESDDVIAQVVADFVRTSDERPIWEQTTLPTVEAAADGARSPEAAMIVAAHAWNMRIALLESERQRDASGLSGTDRQRSERLAETAMRLSRKAVDHAPYLRIPYPIVRSIVNSDGRPFVPATP